jgi:hypothetical protein
MNKSYKDFFLTSSPNHFSYNEKGKQSQNLILDKFLSFFEFDVVNKHTDLLFFVLFTNQ